MRTYEDPLDLIWLDAAAALGWRVERSAEVFASWDGRGTLSISVPEEMDPDDCLAQMILHEICHALVQGPANLARSDWGLENTDDSDQIAEYACHRLQAALLQAWGLRRMLAPTTEHRVYYDALPDDPLPGRVAAAGEAGADPAILLALAGWRRSLEAPWAEVLADALGRTAMLAAVVQGIAPPDSIWRAARAR